MASHCYTYTYRDTSGMVKEGAVSASSRADAFASLKASGISPISLKSVESVAQCHQPRLGIILGYAALFVISVGCILGAYWLFSQRTTTPTPSVPKQQIVAHKVLPTQKRVIASKPSTTMSTNQIAAPAQKQISKQEGPLTEYRGQKVVGYTVTTNANGAILERYKTADGNTHSIVTDPPPIFENSSDQILAMALSVPPGGELPPLPIPPTMEKDFVASLSKPIVINEDDSDEVKKLKEDVIAARKDMQELLKSGRSPSEVLQEHRKLLNENTAIRNQVVKELREIIDSGDVESAEKYIRKMNIALEQMGIMGVSMPKSAEARAHRAATRPKGDDRNVENQQ